MNNKANGVLGIFVLIVVGAGCGLRGLVKDGRYFEGDTARDAAAAIKEKIGKPFKVTEVFIDDNEFRVHAQDPDNPKNLDEYKYLAAGFVSGPNAVKAIGAVDDVEKSSYQFDEIDFAAIPKFTAEAIQRAGIEGAKIYRLTFQRGFALTNSGAGALGNPRWHIEIKGTREDVTATADPKGKILGVDISRTGRAKEYTVLTKDELQKAQDAIRSELASRPAVVDIAIHEKSIGFNVPNQENPKVVDGYTFDVNGLSRGGGLVKSPRPPKSFSEDFLITDVDLTKVPDLIAKTKTRVGMPDAEFYLLTILSQTRTVYHKEHRRVWYVTVKSGVNEGRAIYDNDGNEIRVTKNGETIFEEEFEAVN
ncbi:MAG: hypothetical protein WBD22_07280 [Pyrinomonadaceae bacterium]